MAGQQTSPDQHDSLSSQLFLESTTDNDGSITSKPYSRLENLPVEIHFAILRQVPCVVTLRSIVLSSRPLYNCYIGYRPQILHSVLQSSTTRKLLCEARYIYRIAIDSTASKYENRNLYLDTILKLLRMGSIYNIVSDSISLEELCFLARLQTKVQEIGVDYADTILAKKNGNENRSSTLRAVSPDEFRRIHRGLYRFEMFCTIFGTAVKAHKTREWDIQLFTRMFKEREVEEFACIIRFLFDRWLELLETIEQRRRRFISCQPLPRVVHESKQPDYSHLYVTPFLHPCFFRGLSYYQKVMRSSSIEAQGQILFDDSSLLLRMFNRMDLLLPMQSAMSLRRVDGIDDWRPQRSCDQEGRRRNYHRDAEAADATWLWADLKKKNPRENLRSWGFVIWDDERLLRWPEGRALKMTHDTEN